MQMTLAETFVYTVACRPPSRLLQAGTLGKSWSHISTGNMEDRQAFVCTKPFASRIP